MIKVIFGQKGTGKTKRIIDLANEQAKAHRGDIVFIDDDNRYMFELRHEVRFINATEYNVTSPEMFLGFVSGTAASNYDLGMLFIDGFLRIVREDLNELEDFFSQLEALSQICNLEIILSVSGDVAPEYMQKYLI